MSHPNPPVLIVDDSTDSREMLAEYFAFRGFNVVEAGDGETALAEARAHHPGVILMDLRMPGLDGLEATRRLKADPLLHDIIVIALTALAMPRDEMNAREAGVDGFIAKPYDLKIVGDTVAELLERGRPGRARLA